MGKQGPQAPLVKGGDLPSAIMTDGPATTNQRSNAREDDEDEEDDEENSSIRPWTRVELREKADKALQKRKKFRRKTDPFVALSAFEQNRTLDGEATARLSPATATVDPNSSGVAYDEMVEKIKTPKEESEDSGDGGEETPEEAGPTDEELNEIFFKRYKMSRQELQASADKMGIKLGNLCYLKREFDAYDANKSGYIRVKELKKLLEGLDEKLTDDELRKAFDIDADNGGEVEFFNFVEWFTSEE